MTKVVVYHRGYGCDTGCCGHAIEVDDSEVYGTFEFSHPFTPFRATPEEKEQVYRKWAEEFVTEHLGAEHVADLDWENSFVTDDC